MSCICCRDIVVFILVILTYNLSTCFKLLAMLLTTISSSLFILVFGASDAHEGMEGRLGFTKKERVSGRRSKKRVLMYARAWMQMGDNFHSKNYDAI